MKRPVLKGRRFKRGGRPHLAVDFGVASTTVAVTDKFGSKARIHEAVTIGPDDEDLSALVQERGWSGCRARVVVEESDLLWRRIGTPKLNRRLQTSMLSLEARKFVSGDWKDFHWNYRGTAATKGKPERNCLVSAVGKAQIDDLDTRIRTAGLIPGGFIPLPEAARTLVAPPEDGAVALLDIGATHSRLVVLHEGEAVLYRSLSMGGDHLTEELATIMIPGKPALQFDLEDAHAMKVKHGLLHEPGSHAMEGFLPLGLVTQALRTVLERLVREMYSTFDFWNERFIGIPLAELRLTGNGALVPGLEAYFESVIGLPTRRVEIEAPVPGLDVAVTGALAVGLARADISSIDLSQACPVGEVEIWARRMNWARVTATLVLYLGIGGGFGAFQLKRESTDASIWRSRLQGQEIQADIIRKAEEAEAHKERSREVRAFLTSGAPDWPTILAGLSRHIGEDARLREIRMEIVPNAEGPPTSVLHLSGRITGRERSSEVIAEMMVALRDIPGLGPIELVSSEEDEEGYDGFNLRSRLIAGVLP